MTAEENRMHKYDHLSNASGDSGFSGYSDSSNKSIGQPPLFTQNNQNDTRATERAEVLKKHEYTITEELRRGVSGRVFLVKNPDEDYFVAKEINYRDNVNFNRDAVKKEINILKNLHHGYIVAYEDSFEESGYFYIVSEYCAGGDLFKKMKAQRNTPFEEDQIIDWFVQICLALQFLHENNILHRDIKPQNIFLTEDGFINLGDVGCSKVLQSADEYATTIVGTDLYISPEIYENRHNSKSDIWSLGWLLHDLCMLDMWSNMIERRCLHANSLKGTRPKISNMYSEDLKELFCQMLSLDPHKRPSADEILAKPFLTEAVKRNRRILDALQRRSLSSIDPDNSSATMSYSNQEKSSAESDQTKQQHAGVNRSRHDTTLMNPVPPGPPAVYRLNTERKYFDGTDRKVRKWTYGRRDGNKQNKVILMVGETGSGKTTIINTMINYLLGVKFDDEEFYQITEEDEKHHDQSKSQISEITVYEVFVEENPTALTIIDTPGYGDTEGFEKDGEIAENLTRLFSDNDGIHYIDAVCFVMKASQNRLSGKELYIFHSVLSLFGRNIENNIVFLLTQSDGGPPTDALNGIKKAEIPSRRDERGQPVHFLFNNRQKEERDKLYEQKFRTAWEMGEESMNEFFKLLEEKNRKSVEMTLDVLRERRRLEACVSNLKERIDENESKMKELNQIQEVLRQNRHKIEKCVKFTESIMKEFENTTEIEEHLKSDLEKIKEEKSRLLHEVYISIMNLSKIALKADSAFTLLHLDFLIPRLKEEGKDEWMKNLEDLRKAGEEKKNKGALRYVWERAGQTFNNLFSRGKK